MRAALQTATPATSDLKSLYTPPSEPPVQARGPHCRGGPSSTSSVARPCSRPNLATVADLDHTRLVSSHSGAPLALIYEAFGLLGTNMNSVPIRSYPTRGYKSAPV
jgi:hypothetical protein